MSPQNQEPVVMVQRIHLVVLEVWALVAQFIIPELLALLTLLAAEGQMAVLAALAAAS